MTGSINSNSTYVGAYNSVGSAAITTAKPRLVLVYNRDEIDQEVGTPRISGASRRARVPKSSKPSMMSKTQNRGDRAGAITAALDARAFLRVIVIAAIIFCCSAAFEGMRSTKINQMLDSAPVEEVKVVTGDTLWSIAEQYCGNDVPTEDVVAWMRSHNGLSSAMLTPGQRISVPIVVE